MSANVTSWNSAEDWVTACQGDVLCLQELRLDEEKLRAVSRRLNAARWHMVATPCLRGPGGGNAAGVGIVARKHIGLAKPVGCRSWFILGGSSARLPHRVGASLFTPCTWKLALDCGKLIGTR